MIQFKHRDNKIGKRFIFLMVIAVLVVLPITTLSQNIDSLYKVFKTSQHDSIKLSVLGNIKTAIGNRINKYTYKGDLRSVIKYSEINLKISEYLRDTAQITSELVNMASKYGLMGNSSKEIEYYFKALKIHQYRHDNTWEVNTLLLISYAYENQNDNENALKFYLECLKVSQESKDPNDIIRSYNALGIFYSGNNDKFKAIDYYKKGLNLSDSMHIDEQTSMFLNNLSILYNDLGDYSKALEYNDKNLLIRQKSNPKYIFSAYRVYGDIYTNMKDKIKALEAYNKALEIHENNKNMRGIYDITRQIYILFEKLNNNTEALKYGLKAMTIAEKQNQAWMLKEASFNLTNAYKKVNNYKKAFEMNELYILLKDSIDSEETKKSSIKKVFQYEFEKRETELNIKTKIEKEKTEAIAKEEKEKQQLITFSVLIGLFLVIAFAGFMFNRFKVTNRQNKLITEQKSILEHQKQEITDSINYSKRIQTAILPDLADIKQSLSEFFVLYQPKDIVSGDFYYFNKVNNDVFIAAADCTGHGVPGAFMSLVGSKELKIANAMTNSPAQILKHLNNGVKDTLRQNHIDGTKDGMDIALVRINGTTVTYSAANRPLWILKKDSTLIEEIKATKTAIAGFTEDDFEFEEHTLNLAKGDTIYLFSDGYADQFGGDKQKKMTTKRFRELIITIKDKSMDGQQLQLESFFNTWQGNTEQVDDLLVIGIRL